MEKVWEAKVFTTGVILFLIFSLIIVLCCVYFLIKSQSVSNFERGKIVCIVVLAVLLIINLQNISDRYNEIKYAERNSMVVEGQVENLQYYTNGADSFSVNGVFFSYPTSESAIGYNIPKREKNSIIQYEGQYVYITYYSKNEVNIITRIETVIEYTNDFDKIFTE